MDELQAGVRSVTLLEGGQRPHAGPTLVVIEPDPIAGVVNSTSFVLEELTAEKADAAVRSAGVVPVTNSDFANASLRRLASVVAEQRPGTAARVRTAADPQVHPQPALNGGVRMEYQQVPTVPVKLELADGFEITVNCHDVIVTDTHLTLAFDRNAGGNACRPGASTQPVRLWVDAHKSEPACVFLAIATGFTLSHRGWEYVVFTICESSADDQ